MIYNRGTWIFRLAGFDGKDGEALFPSRLTHADIESYQFFVRSAPLTPLQRGRELESVSGSQRMGSEKTVRYCPQ